MNQIDEVLHGKSLKKSWLSDRQGNSFDVGNHVCDYKRSPSLETAKTILHTFYVSVNVLITSNIA